MSKKTHSVELPPVFCIAARALLGWSQTELSEAADVARKTISDFETNRRDIQTRTVNDIRRTFEENGVVFILKGGVIVGLKLAEK